MGTAGTVSGFAERAIRTRTAAAILSFSGAQSESATRSRKFMEPDAWKGLGSVHATGFLRSVPLEPGPAKLGRRCRGNCSRRSVPLFSESAGGRVLSRLYFHRQLVLQTQPLRRASYGLLVGDAKCKQGVHGFPPKSSVWGT